MLRLFLVLSFLFLNLLACKGGYDSCKQKTIDSLSVEGNSLQIPIKNNQRLVFSIKTPNAKIIKHDPYLSLYIVEDRKSFKYPFRINNKLTLAIAAVNDKIVCEGNIIRHQVGLNRFAEFSEPLFAPSILLNSCCELEGIITHRGIIEKDYIERFLKIHKVSYSDVGIRVKDDKNLVLVTASNPFVKDNPFKVGDCILEFDGKKVETSATLMKNILFSEIDSNHKVKIKRDKKIFTVDAKSEKRYGGGYLYDGFVVQGTKRYSGGYLNKTLLEFLGISFDENLGVLSIEPNVKKYNLRIGDKLLEINGKKIKNESDIFKELQNSKKSANVLFRRGQFQFFIRVD